VKAHRTKIVTANRQRIDNRIGTSRARSTPPGRRFGPFRRHRGVGPPSRDGAAAERGAHWDLLSLARESITRRRQDRPPRRLSVPMRLTAGGRNVLSSFMNQLNQTIANWLAQRTQTDDATGCLTWKGALFDGYAYGRLPGERATKVARALYERAHGPLGPGMVVRQACGNRACCELGHMVVSSRGAAVLAGRGACAENARKTSCKRGHPFDEANTYIDPAGRRRCRACTRDMEGAWHAAGNRKNQAGVRRCEVVEAA